MNDVILPLCLAASIMCMNSRYAVTVPYGPGIAKAAVRPRVIVSTDFPPLDVIPVKAVKPGDPPEKCSDPDDVQSMVRFLLYTNELDVEGLVASAGTFANVAKKQNILDILALYAKVHPRLILHDPRFPTADRLKSMTWEGRSGAWGWPSVGTTGKPLTEILGTGKDSEASDQIIRVVDSPDTRPVWICVWGGSREPAQALWKVSQTRTLAELKKFVRKIRLYLIAKQDSTADWLLENFPDLFIILSEKNYMGMFWSMSGSDSSQANLDWTTKHIRSSRGPLGAAYPRSGWDPEFPGVWEGDSPSFLHLISGLRGVNDPEKPEQAGWGGQFQKPNPAKNHWFDVAEGSKAVWRWRKEFQEDFARKLSWM